MEDIVTKIDNLKKYISEVRAKVYSWLQSAHQAHWVQGVMHHGSWPALEVSVGRLITPGARPAMRHPPASYYIASLSTLGA